MSEGQVGGPDPPCHSSLGFVGLGWTGRNRAKIFQTSIPVVLEAVPTLHSQVQLRGGKRQKRPFTEGLSGGQIFQVASSTPGVPGGTLGGHFRHSWVPGSTLVCPGTHFLGSRGHFWRPLEHFARHSEHLWSTFGRARVSVDALFTHSGASGTVNGVGGMCGA